MSTKKNNFQDKRIAILNAQIKCAQALQNSSDKNIAKQATQRLKYLNAKLNSLPQDVIDGERYRLRAQAYLTRDTEDIKTYVSFCKHQITNRKKHYQKSGLRTQLKYLASKIISPIFS